jgi:heme-degrading monooxygenase HmoA
MSVICRLWRGWTTPGNARAYGTYLQDELFPRVQRELSGRGYLGFDVLQLTKGDEVEFVTMVWFESLQAVKSFAGEDYATPVITQKAHSLLSRYEERVEHYELSRSSWPHFDSHEVQPVPMR